MISEEMHRLGSQRSSIRELFEYGRELAKSVGAENVFDYSLGNPSTPPPRALTEAAISLLAESEPTALHGYTSAQGSYEARCAVSKDLFSRFGASVDPERIYMTCGAAASLCITLRAIISSPEDEVVAIAPYFPEYKVFTEGAGGRFCSAEPNTKSFGINFDSLDACINKNTRAVIINSPNNPSGKILSKNELERLAALLDARSKELGERIYIISDEPYREIAYEKKVSYLPDIYSNTIICYSYSKSLSLPGERIGYIALPCGIDKGKELYAAICGAGRSLGYVCAPSFMQKLISRCSDLTPNLSVYRENRDLLYSSLTKMGYDAVMPEGAFYLFLRSPIPSSREFSERAKGLGLLLVPGDDFGCPGYLRISYCVDTGMIKRSLPTFEKLIKELE